MKRAKMLLIAAGAAVTVLFLTAGGLLYGSISRFHDLEHELETRKANLTGFYQENPYPSAPNVRVEATNVATVAGWCDALMARLSMANVRSDARSPSLFKKRLGITGSLLKRKALKRNTTLPDDFAFGFAAYSKEKSPSPDNVPRLMEQLEITEKLCEALFTNRVKAIASIVRDEFEKSQVVAGSSASGAVSRRRTRGRRHRSPAPTAAPASAQTSVKNAGLIKDGALYAKYSFLLEFSSSSASLLGVLNDLASSEMFTVVTSVRLKKEIPDLMPPPDTGTDNDEDLDPDKPLLREPEKPVQCRVCGPELELPMDVRIEVDVYKFKEERISAGS